MKIYRGCKIIGCNILDDYWFEIQDKQGKFVKGNNRYDDSTTKSFEDKEEAKAFILEFLL